MQPEARADNSPDDARFRYVPALDGLRSIAIVLVILFHYPWDNPYGVANPVHGGFLGVDVFFVLSGFLITSLLLQERSDTGSVSLRGFYARRALRLFPAFFVLFACAVVAHFAFVEPSRRPSLLGLFGMAAYMANWVQLWAHDPLGQLFGHTWSLAIEEQFYLVFPLLFIAMLRARFSRLMLALALLAGAITSALWRAHLWHRSAAPPSFVDWYVRVTGRPVQGTDPFAIWNRWYFGTDSRLDALLIGCLAAVVLVVIRPKLTPMIRSVMLALALVAMVVAGVMINKVAILSGWLPEWGLFVFVVLVAIAVLGIVVNPRSLPTRLFALAPLVWIGRRSYAIYLFHQIVYYEVGSNRTHLPPFWNFWLDMIVVAVIAELSWRYVEQPFLRRKGRFVRVAPDRERDAAAVGASD